jgi:ornithine cyclodeaminase/alanine dehydrogenase-like protein (mu-crystallin family)
MSEVDPMSIDDALPAFRVAKPEREVRLLSEAAVRRLLDPRALLDGLHDGFAALSRDEVQSPQRPEITVPGAGFSLAMMAWRPGWQICVKVVNVFEANLGRGLPSHLALITLYDPDTGAATCVMDGTYITGIRTAAAAVLSARLLSRPDAKIATIVGAGVQASEHVRLLPLVRDLQRINICSLVDEHAEQLAATSAIAVPRADRAAAVAEADIVCLASHSADPVIEPGWVRPGAHVSSVGYHPPAGELPFDLPREHTLYVEDLDALRPPPVGCAELTGLAEGKATCLGDVVLGRSKGRTDQHQITVYKAMGIGMEDLVAAQLVYDAARALGTDDQFMSW